MTPHRHVLLPPQALFFCFPYSVKPGSGHVWVVANSSPGWPPLVGPSHRPDGTRQDSVTGGSQCGGKFRWSARAGVHGNPSAPVAFTAPLQVASLASTNDTLRFSGASAPCRTWVSIRKNGGSVRGIAEVCRKRVWAQRVSSSRGSRTNVLHTQAAPPERVTATKCRPG